MTDVPQWAIERVVQLWDAEPPETHDIRDAFARYIAAHEEPPVDQLYEAVKAVVELGRYDTREQVALLRHELAERGLEIVERSHAR